MACLIKYIALCINAVQPVNFNFSYVNRCDCASNCLAIQGQTPALTTLHTFLHICNPGLQDPQIKFGRWGHLCSKTNFDSRNVLGPARINSVQLVNFNFSHMIQCNCASNCLAIQGQTPALTTLHTFLHIFNTKPQDPQNKFGRWVQFGGAWSQESQSQPWGHDHEQHALQVKFICHYHFLCW